MKVNSFFLKITAFIATVLLYVALYFTLPGNLVFLKYIFGILGASSFTLYAFLINEGLKHTGNVNKYVIRVLICAVISAFPFHAIIKTVFPNTADITAYFSPALSALIALLAVSTLGKLKEKNLKLILMFMVCLLSFFFNFFGAPFFFITVFVMYYFDNNFGKMAYIISSLYIAFFVVGIIFKLFFNYDSQQELDLMIYQIGCILPLPLIHKYDGTEGPKLKYLTYILNVLLLFGISILVNI